MSRTATRSSLARPLGRRDGTGEPGTAEAAHLEAVRCEQLDHVHEGVLVPREVRIGGLEVDAVGAGECHGRATQDELLVALDVDLQQRDPRQLCDGVVKRRHRHA